MTTGEIVKLREIAIITGPAGAGRSTAINALEDLGFEAIDNLPIKFLKRLFAGDAEDRPIAIGVDTRTRDFSASALLQTLADLSEEPGLNISLVYLDCAKDVMIRRYSETRRRHPLSPNEDPLIGIEREQALLAPLLERANILIDTSEMSPHDLRGDLARWFGQEAGPGLSISVQSFSYKRGTPRAADMVLDCRFLRNPHWCDDLRGFTGQDARVAEYVKDDPRYEQFFDQLIGMLTLLLPAYKAEGKSYFTISLGCTGGKHRSVCITESVAKSLAQDGWQVSIRHRELERTHGLADSKSLVVS